MRLDAVHYCEREAALAEKRKHRSFFDRNGDPEDASQVRLQLFARTVRKNKHLGSLVELLKMPYMTRESCISELARAVSALPNLRYIDLPDGFFRYDQSSVALRQELQHRCPSIRRMKYTTGAENALLTVEHAQLWPQLEILELCGLSVDLQTALLFLSSFPALQEVKLQSFHSFDDSLFALNTAMAFFPPVNTLALEDVSMISAHGIVSYLSRPETGAVIANLSLSDTAVLPQELHNILAAAPNLKTLTIKEVVARPFPITPVPPLSSASLEELRFEILPSQNSSNPPSESYYSYLANSLLLGGMYSLSSLFAYSTSLPDLLLFPPVAPFGGNHAPRSPSPHRAFLGARRHSPSRASSFSTSNSSTSSTTAHTLMPSSSLIGLRCPLRLYTKPAAYPELEWSLTDIDPPSAANGRQGSFSATRPLSVLRDSPQRTPRPLSPSRSSTGGNGYGPAGGSAVLASNHEFGGFLAVPAEDHASNGTAVGRGRNTKMGSWNSEWMG